MPRSGSRCVYGSISRGPCSPAQSRRREQQHNHEECSPDRSACNRVTKNRTPSYYQNASASACDNSTSTTSTCSSPTAIGRPHTSQSLPALLLPKREALHSLHSMSVEVTHYDDYDDDDDDDDDGAIRDNCTSLPFSSASARSRIASVLLVGLTLASILLLPGFSSSVSSASSTGSNRSGVLVSDSSTRGSSSSSSSSSSSAVNSALSLLGSFLNFDGVLASGAGGGGPRGDGTYQFQPGDDSWQSPGNAHTSSTTMAPTCEYISAHPALEAVGAGTRSRRKELVGIQTSKKEPGHQWSEFGCNERTGSGKDVITPGSDAANIVIELPTPSRESADEKLKKKFQKILGFGGSITEATTLNWKSLSSVARDRVLELLYGDSGLGYTLGRVPMGSCDFSVSSYNFADKEDLTLSNFDTSVQRDYDNGMIDMIKSAIYVTQHSWEEGTELSLVASPWSPPAWMKQPLPTDPFDATHARTMEQTVLPECLREGTSPQSRYARAWAQYFSEFISAYKGHGIDFWAVTVQNEPLSLPKFEACGHDKTTEEEFVTNHLGPVLEEDHPNIKILAYDTNKDQCVDFMEHFWGGDSGPIEAAATKYIDGAALHWYSRLHPDLDGGEGAPNMHRLKALASQHGLNVQDATEDKKRRLLGEKPEGKAKEDVKEPILLDTEATHCVSTGYAIGNLRTSWQRAERSAHAILSQLAAGSNGWIEWNMMLDPFGGPNHVENFCDAPLVAVPHRAEGLSDFIQPVPSFEKHQLQDGESIKGEYETKFSLSITMGYPMSLMNLGVVVQPMYYYMGHISRHVRPGSRPLKAIVDESTGGISSRTFRPTGRIGSGGGYNTIARDGTEVTFWPCEGSTRQSWSFSIAGELQMVQYNRKRGSMECVSLAAVADPDLGGILLTQCGGPDSGLYDMVAVEGSFGGTAKNLVKFRSRKVPDTCLGIRTLANDGGSYGPRGGAQATMLPCEDKSTMWSLSTETGEVSSTYFAQGDVCMTTGWPFLQAGVFDTTEVPGERGNKMTMVVLNESEDDAAFVVRANDKKSSPLLKSTIPAHSIQTFLI